MAADRWAGLLAARRWWVSGLSIFLGALLALSLPPFNLLIFLVLFGWPVLRLGHAVGAWSAFWIGWTFGFGYFVAGLYWISNALLVYGDKHAWLVPFAAAGLPAVLSVYWGIAAVICHGLERRWSMGPISRALILASLLGFAEWVRGVAFTGFPWNLPAYVWSDTPRSFNSLLLSARMGSALSHWRLDAWAVRSWLQASRGVAGLLLQSFSWLRFPVRGCGGLTGCPTEPQRGEGKTRLSVSFKGNIPQAEK